MKKMKNEHTLFLDEHKSERIFLAPFRVGVKFARNQMLLLRSILLVTVVPLLHLSTIYSNKTYYSAVALLVFVPIHRLQASFAFLFMNFVHDLRVNSYSILKKWGMTPTLIFQKFRSYSQALSY